MADAYRDPADPYGQHSSRPTHIVKRFLLAHYMGIEVDQVEMLISPTFLFSCEEFPDVRTKDEYCNMMAHARSVHQRYSVFVDDAFGEGGKVAVRFRVEGVRSGASGEPEVHETSVFGIFLVEHGKVEEFHLMAQPIASSSPIVRSAAEYASAEGNIANVATGNANANANANANVNANANPGANPGNVGAQSPAPSIHVPPGFSQAGSPMPNAQVTQVASEGAAGVGSPAFVAAPTAGSQYGQYAQPSSVVPYGTSSYYQGSAVPQHRYMQGYVPRASGGTYYY